MFRTVQSWLARPATRAERVAAICVTTFCGFWLGLAIGAIAEWTVPLAAHWSLWISAASGAVLGCLLGWNYPKQALTVLNARALFSRNDNFR